MVAGRGDGARVDDADVRLFFREDVPALLGELGERLRLKLIDLAAKRCKAKFHNCSSDDGVPSKCKNRVNFSLKL